MFSIKAGETAPADSPQNAIPGGCKAADALVDFGRERNVDEVKRTLRRTSCFDVLRVGDPDAAVRAHVDACRKRLWGGDFFRGQGCRIKAGKSARIAKDPHSAVRSKGHFASDGAIEAVP